jgi:hypothetical protein
LAEDWASIAAEVEAAIASIGDVSQPDGFPAALRRVTTEPGENPWNPPVETVAYLTIRVVDENKRLRDIDGTLINRTMRTLMVGASVPPIKTDTVAIGITGAQAEAAAEAATEEEPDTTQYHVIQEVRPLAPAGIVVMYEIELAA